MPGHADHDHHHHHPVRHAILANGTNTSSNVKELYRVVVMGKAKVGKTAIVSQFLYDRFVPEYKPTVEELHRGEYEMAASPLTLDILDTSGSNEFPAMRALSITNADAFLLVYSIDDPESFDQVRSLRDLILETKEATVPLVVVGNKCDLEHRRQVIRETTETIVTIDWENGFVEASAKDNVNIVAIFKELLTQARVPYALSPAVRRRRQSLPSCSPTKMMMLRNGSSSNNNEDNHRPVKRNSCVIS